MEKDLNNNLNEFLYSIDNLCSSSYMTLTQILPELVDAGFIVLCSGSGTGYYKITQEGRDCLNYFFTKVPASTRNDISSYIKKNRQSYKRNQEYFRDYYKVNAS